MQCKETSVLSKGQEYSPGEENSNLLQYFCLEIPWTEKFGGLYSPWGRKSQTPSGGGIMVPSYHGNSMFSVMRNCQTVYQSSCRIL